MATTIETTQAPTFDMLVEIAAETVAAKERDAEAKRKAEQEEEARQIIENFRAGFDGWLDQTVLDACAVRYEADTSGDRYNKNGKAILTVEGEEWRIAPYASGFHYIYGPAHYSNYADKADFQTAFLAAVAQRREKRAEEAAARALAKAKAGQRQREPENTASAAPEPREFPKVLATNYGGRVVALSVRSSGYNIATVMVVATLPEHGGVTLAMAETSDEYDEDGRRLQRGASVSLTAQELDALDVARAEWKAELAKLAAERASHQGEMEDTPF